MPARPRRQWSRAPSNGRGTRSARWGAPWRSVRRRRPGSWVTTTRPPVAEPAMEGVAELTYEDFGRQLFHQVLHRERIEDAVATVLGDRIEVGPIGAGPGRRFATIRAVGTIGRPRAEPLGGDLVAYRVTLPIDVDFDLDLAVDL